MNECRGPSQHFFYAIVAASCGVALPAELPSMKICEVSESWAPVETGMGWWWGKCSFTDYQAGDWVCLPQRGRPLSSNPDGVPLALLTLPWWCIHYFLSQWLVVRLPPVRSWVLPHVTCNTDCSSELRALPTNLVPLPHNSLTTRREWLLCAWGPGLGLV